MVRHRSCRIRTGRVRHDELRIWRPFDDAITRWSFRVVVGGYKNDRPSGCRPHRLERSDPLLSVDRDQHLDSVHRSVHLDMDAVRRREGVVTDEASLRARVVVHDDAAQWDDAGDIQWPSRVLLRRRLGTGSGEGPGRRGHVVRSEYLDLPWSAEHHDDDHCHELRLLRNFPAARTIVLTGLCTILVPCQWRGAVAQWSEQGTHNPSVAGSIPAGPTTCFVLHDMPTTCCVVAVDLRRTITPEV
jgi:hypothetical protein